MEWIIKMFNLAVFLMILVYVSICAVVVGSWAFKTIDEDTAGIMDNIDDDDNDTFEQGDIL